MADPETLAGYRNSAVGHAGESRNDFFLTIWSLSQMSTILGKAAKLLLAKRILLGARKLPAANSGKMRTYQSRNYRNLL